MRKAKVIFPLLFVLSFFQIKSLFSQCGGGTANTTLETNNIKAYFANGGNLGSSINISGGGGSVISVSDSVFTPRWASGIWISGVNEEGDLLLNAAQYQVFGGTSCFWPGPYMDGSMFNDFEDCENWDIIFEVSNDDIVLFQADLADNGQLDEPIPSTIQGWPAIGNPLFFDQHGFELPLKQLAPFVDNNNDSVYNPLDGDYPDIKEASKALWWILNTNGNINSCNATNNLNVEIQILAYAYSSTDIILNNSIFHDLTIIQKGEQVLDNAYFSYWTDVSGRCSNEMIGSFPEEDYVFYYENRDATPSNCTGGIFNNFKNSLLGLKQLKGPLSPRVFDAESNLVYPEIGMVADTFVEQKMSSFKHYYRPSPNSESFEEDPSVFSHYYNYMQGNWSDGQEQEFNGVPSKFAYPGNPANPMEGDYPMCNEEFEFADIRTVMNCGPLRMDPESRHKFSYVLSRIPLDENIKCPDISILTEGFENIERRQNEITSTSKVPDSSGGNVAVFPNPASSSVTFQLKNEEEKISSIKIYDIAGASVSQIDHVDQASYRLPLGASMSAGTYFYLLVSDKGNVYSGKILKMI